MEDDLKSKEQLISELQTLRAEISAYQEIREIKIAARKERRQLINRTALLIRDCLNVEDILQTTVTEIRGIIKSDRLIIYQFQPDGTGLVVKEAVVDPKFSILDRTVIDQCFGESWVELYQQGRTRSIDDIYTEPDINECYQQFLQNFDIRANLVVPIIQKNHLWGLLIAHECTASRNWTTADVDFMNQLAIQVGIAIQQASLIEKLQTELSQRIQAEATLQAREKQLELFAKYAPAAIAMFDRNMCYVMASQRWVDDYQIESIAAIIGKSHYELFPEIPDRWRQIHQRCLAGVVEKCDEDLFVRADGLNQWLRWEVRPWYNNNNEICGIIIFSEDITQRKQLEIDLKISEERLRLTLDLTGIGSWDWNIQTYQSLWNDNQFLNWGIEPKSVVPSYTIWQQQIHPDDLERVEQELQKALQTQIPYHAEYRIYRQNDGTVHWMMEKAHFLCDESGQPMRMLGITMDITERKQAELALQKFNLTLEQRVAERTIQLSQANDHLQRELFQREKLERELKNREKLLDGFFYAASQANVGLSIVDTNFHFLKINQALADTDGYSIEAHLRKSVIELLPDIAPTVLPILQTVLNTKKPIANLEISGIVPSQPQVIRYWLVSYFPILGEKGNAVALGTIIIEITKRKHLELEREKLIGIIEATSDIIGTVRFETQKTEYVNKAGRRFLNLADDAPIDHISIADVHPQWALEIIQKQGIPAAVRHGVWVGETALINHQGQEIPISQVLIAQTFGSNHTQYLSTIARDITEQKQIEATLKESDRRWKSLLDNVQLVVIGLDISGNVEYANPFFFQLTNYTEIEVLGKNWVKNFLPQSQHNLIKTTFQEVIEKNFYPHYQNPILTKSGEERMISWSNTLLRDVEGNPIGTISIGEDITERYKLERMKAEFISVVSHELRTPLTSMQAGLSLLHEKIIDANSPEGEATIEIATEGVDRLVRLVNDILDLERLESGKIRLEKSVFNTIDLINTAISQMQDMAILAGIILNATPSSYQVYADPDRLLQVIINLLSNAIKFSPPGSNIWLTVEKILSPVTCHLSPLPSPYLLFTVKDQGRGIPSHSLDSIFERFHQVDASDSRSKGGTGLGLAICRNIVEQHGGTIWAKSVLGEGSTFYFTLPIEEVSNGK
jgi:PAS domain S-box-containing protein